MTLNCGQWMSFRYLHSLGMLAIETVLLFALYDQFFLNDIPCPLCLLQRLGFTSCMVALLLSVIYGPKPWHYGLLLLSALFGASVALRQISLHVIPDSPPYGMTFFSLHLYTWACIIFVLILTSTGVLLLIPSPNDLAFTQFTDHPPWVRYIIIIGLLVTCLNMVAALLECGFWACASNPKGYKLL